MGRRNTTRNRYPRRNNGYNSNKLTKQQIRQRQIEQYNRLNTTMDNNYMAYFNNMLYCGLGIKVEIMEIYDGLQGSEYNHILIPQTDIEVKLDKIMLCYSIHKQKYLTIGFDYSINTAYILFYSVDLDKVIGNLNMDDIITEKLTGQTEHIKQVQEELKNYDHLWNLQDPNHNVKSKYDIFPELEIDNMPTEQIPIFEDI